MSSSPLRQPPASPIASPTPRQARRLATIIALIVLSPLLLAFWPNGGAASLDRVGSAAVSGSAPELSPMPRPTLPKPLLGFAVNAHHISNMPAYLRSVDAIHEMGANTLIVVTPMFQKYVDSNRISSPRGLCPSDTQLRALLTRARNRGMFTVLMPIVLIEKPGDKDWRGLIRPTDWDLWWESYRENLDRFVRIANDTGVDLFSVGSELNSTEQQLERWTAVVQHVRQQYPGKLTYSANWDRYDQIALWPHVDVMSVSSYFELERDRPGAPVADLVRAWEPIRGELLETARRWNRPLMLSEVGYPSLPWANAHPWNYVPEADSTSDPAAQARSWRAFFEAWTNTLADPASNLQGFCGYRWDPYHAGEDDDVGYGIAGKPAHEVIKKGFTKVRQRSARPAE